LTVACVPTGMKIGVGMSPWAVCRIPARARVSGHSARSSNVMERGNSDCIASPSPSRIRLRGTTADLTRTRDNRRLPRKTILHREQADRIFHRRKRPTRRDTLSASHGFRTSGSGPLSCDHNNVESWALISTFDIGLHAPPKKSARGFMESPGRLFSAGNAITPVSKPAQEPGRGSRSRGR
jgi:hypothetical protein